jgi:tetratricopeptide (TPR) repeat protein
MAHLHYLRGQILWKLERYDESRTAFIKARDEDVCPLRIVTPMREVVQAVAREHQVPLVPVATVVDSRSPHAVPGNDFFLDHVHPTIEGHQLLADLILEKLTEMDIVHPVTEWNETARQNVIQRVEETFDPRDHALALRNLSKVLTWSGKFAEADRLALQAVVELQDDPEAHFLAGNAELRQDRHGEAIAHFEKTIQLDPGYIKAYNNLGNEYFQLGELDRAAEYFAQAVRADPQFVLGFHNLGVVHFESGQVDSAIGFLDKALALEPDRFDSHWLLSKIYYEQKRYAEARHHMQRAVEIRPHDEGARSDLEMLSKLIE